MRWQLTFAIRLWFLFITHGSLATTTDMCSSTTYKFASNTNSLTLRIKNSGTMPGECSCKITTNPAALTCSFDTCSPCFVGLETACALLCLCARVDLTISPTCTATSITWINCLLVGHEARSCQTSTKFLINSPISCSTEKKNEDLFMTLQPIKIGDDEETSEHMFKEGDCAAGSDTPNVSSTSVTPATSIYSSATVDIKYSPTSDVQSTPKSETTGRPSPTLVSGSMIMNMTSGPFINSGMVSYDSGKNIGIGVGVGVGGGILLIIAIIIVILILRRRRVESQKLRAKDTTQPTAAAGAGAAPSETSYESYRVPVVAPYDNATNGVTASGYQTITYENEPIGESNDGYTEIKEPEEAINHNGYDECRVGRNEVYTVLERLCFFTDKVMAAVLP